MTWHSHSVKRFALFLFINEPFVQAFELKSFVIPVVNLIHESLITFFGRNCSMICAGVIFLTCRCDLPCEIKSYKCVEFLHLPPATLKYQFMINQHRNYIGLRVDII